MSSWLFEPLRAFDALKINKNKNKKQQQQQQQQNKTKTKKKRKQPTHYLFYVTPQPVSYGVGKVLCVCFMHGKPVSERTEPANWLKSDLSDHFNNKTSQKNKQTYFLPVFQWV